MLKRVNIRVAPAMTHPGPNSVARATTRAARKSSATATVTNPGITHATERRGAMHLMILRGLKVPRAKADRSPNTATILPVLVPRATHHGPMASPAVPIRKAEIA